MRDQLEINVRRQLAPRPHTDLDGAKYPKFHVSRAVSGISSAFELAIRFVEWTKHNKVTHLTIMRDWQVSRATAYRWLRAYHAAYGMAHKGRK